MKISITDKVLNYINISLLVIISLACLFPFINVLATSFSSDNAITSGKVTMYPIGFNLDYYNKVLPDPAMLKSLQFTSITTVIFVILALFATTCAAYPLSKKNLKGRKTITMLITFTMYFTGGIIPTFIMVKNLNLIDTMWSLIFPIMINTYYLIIMKSFFSSIPESLTEAAIIDGCNEIEVLFRIVLPLSLPIIATMALFYAVQRWNTVQDAIFYITSTDKYPLQMKLRALVLLNQVNDQQDVQITKTINTEGLKAASLIYATVPILIAYPWLQKYFVKGMTIGAVKG